MGRRTHFFQWKVPNEDGKTSCAGLRSDWRCRFFCFKLCRRRTIRWKESVWNYRVRAGIIKSELFKVKEDFCGLLNGHFQPVIEKLGEYLSNLLKWNTFCLPLKFHPLRKASKICERIPAEQPRCSIESHWISFENKNNFYTFKYLPQY